jgi:uncharacterized protein
MGLAFEWDPRKARANWARHRVSFEEASTVFGDALSLTIPDTLHSVGEQRYVTIGLSVQRRLVVVAHTDRPGGIRIISARKATRRERQAYEEGE